MLKGLFTKKIDIIDQKGGPNNCLKLNPYDGNYAAHSGVIFV